MAQSAAPKIRVQIVTASGASFKLEPGGLVAGSATDVLPRVGEIVQVKSIVTHAQEPGTRRAADGTTPPRDIIHSFRATFGKTEVFAADLGPGVSANPFIAFRMRLSAPGELVLTWTGDNGFAATATVFIPVA